MERYLLLSLIYFIFNSAIAQKELLKLIDATVSKELGDRGSTLRDQFDSIDFQFAISINEGAGFFDIEQKGETTSKLLYGFKSTEDKTLVEKLRDSLDIATGMYDIRRYHLAENQLRKTLRQLEQNQLNNHIVYLRAISNLALINLTQGKLAEANRLIIYALHESEKKLGKNSPAYISNLNNMGKLNQLEGKYTEAEKKFNESLALAKEEFGSGMQVAIILNNQAMLYQTIGQFDKAVETMKEAIEQSKLSPKKPLQGERSFDNRKFQANLATLYQASGRMSEAETLFLELKKVFEAKKQTNNAEYAALNNQIGILYFEMGKMDQVSNYLITSLNVYRKRWGENNIYFAKGALDLGNYYLMKGEMENGKKWLDRSFEIRSALLEANHPDFIKCEESLALYNWQVGEKEKANELYKNVMDKTLVIIQEFFPAFSESEKTHFWDITSPRFQRYYSFALDYYAQNPAVINDIFRYNSASKGILLHSSSRVRNLILSSNDRELIQLFQTWVDKKEELAQLYSYSKAKLKTQSIDVRVWEEETNRLEKELTARSSEFDDAFHTRQVELSDIQKTLSAGEVLVDLIRVNQFSFKKESAIRYAALVIKPAEKPVLKILENGQQLETVLFSGYKNKMKFKLADIHSFEHYWGPIHSFTANDQRIYFSPDGIYNQININTLQHSDKSYFIQKQDLIVLGNASDLKIVNKPIGSSKINNRAFLLGSPDYGNDAIPPLPGTLREIQSIANILQSSGYTMTSVVDKNATENQVKKIDNYKIIHIATHGFFQADKNEKTESLFGSEIKMANDNPLLRSGLILANSGSKLADTASVDLTMNDNGILTAYEAMNLNLKGTDLVILSACETGLGELKAGQGVYGLQRSFNVAGAQSIIMSLWQVNDESSQVLMTQFYENWTLSGNKHEAFRQAQIGLIERYKHPYYWGAFVMHGS